MKKTLTLFLSFLISFFSFSQCSNDNTLNGSISILCPSSQTISCIFGGQYILMNVTSGNIYNFSTCGGAAWDTQITLFNNIGGSSLGYNDDACFPQSNLSWTATFSGQIRVLVDQFNCTNNSSCTSLVISCSAPTTYSNCSPSINVCNSNPITWNSNNIGVQELNASNSGCLIGLEHRSTWLVLNINANGNLGFVINPNGTADYDFALWGPNSTCPPSTLPVRCSFSIASFAGLSSTGTGPTDGTAPDAIDGWASLLPVTSGQTYLLLVDNFNANTTSFTITFQGNVIGCPILPVTVLLFNGINENENNKLYWITATEENNDYFNIERSQDLLQWDLVGSVKSNDSNSQTQQSYVLYDNDYNSVINYYRLIQVDLNGSMENKGMISINNINDTQHPWKVTNILGQEVDSYYRGIVIKYYTNKTIKTNQ